MGVEFIIRQIDKRAVQASKDSNIFDSFVQEQEFFIIKCTSKYIGRYITKNDDEWSIALSAFSEAIEDYTYFKGSFLSFAKLIIQRRMVDYIRKQSKNKIEILVSPSVFSCEIEEDECTSVENEVIEKISLLPKNEIKDEIISITEQLALYGFSFYDLISCSPKAEKTKVACAKAIRFIADNLIIYNEMRKSKTLPLKIIEENTKVPRKILERHRKYIIAAAEIITGDYPCLAEYMRFVREENGK